MPLIPVAAPRRLQVVFKTLQDTPKVFQEASQSGQVSKKHWKTDGFSMFPVSGKIVCKRTPRRPKTLQDGSKTLQDAPRRLRDGSKTLQDGFKTLQNASKTLQNVSQMPPRCFQDAQGSRKAPKLQNTKKTNGFPKVSVSEQLVFKRFLVKSRGVVRQPGTSEITV